LVADHAETCSVCHQGLPSARSAVPVGAVAQAGGGAPFGGSAPLGAGSPAGVGPPVARKRPSKRKGVWTLVVAVVLFYVLRVFGGVFGLADMLGITSGPEPIDLAALQWEPYVDPFGRFSVELPGSAIVDTLEVSGPFGPIDAPRVGVEHDAFNAAVVPLQGVVEPGDTWVTLPVEEIASEMEARGVEGAAVDLAEIVEGSADTTMDTEVSGIMEGAEVVFLTRTVLHAGTVYELAVSGVAEDRVSLLAVFDRLTASFVLSPPA
jgi:hypothetical protein